MDNIKDLNPESFYEMAKEDFQRAKSKVNPNEKLNKKGRAFWLFPLLERNGINTWQDLQSESFLIDTKQSQKSREVRDAVTHLHTHCLLQCANEIKTQFDE